MDGEKEKPGLVATLRNLNRRRMLSVFMTTIYSQLCGIGIVTAYLIDIFESSINALTLVLVSSPTFYIIYSPLNFRFHSFLVESARRNPSFGVLHYQTKIQTKPLHLDISNQISSFTVVTGSCLQMIAADMLGRCRRCLFIC